MRYQYREGFSAKVSAEVVGPLLEAIREDHEGIVAPKAVVDAARPRNAPLHPCFEWDDQVAGEKYRLDQARRIISSIRIVDLDNPNRARHDDERIVYLSVANHPKKDGEPGYIDAGYMSVEDIARRPTMTQRVIQDALAQLRAWQKRYSKITGLREIVQALDNLLPPAA